MGLNDKLRLFCSSERTDEEIEALFLKIIAAQNGGVHINRAIESSLTTVHIVSQGPEQRKVHRDGNAVRYLIGRHIPIILDLQLQGYGYGKIASILARRKIYNKKTNKAYSRQTIKNVLDTIKKEKNGNA